MPNLKYISPFISLSKNSLLLLFVVLLLGACRTKPPKSPDFSMLYPYDVQKRHLEALYDSAKWDFYRAHATTNIQLIKTSKNSQWDTTGLPKTFDLITCPVDTMGWDWKNLNYYIDNQGRRHAQDTTKISFCFLCKGHSLCSDPVIYRSSYYAYPVYICKNKVLGAGYYEGGIIDSLLTKKERSAKDSIFRHRLHEFRTQLPLWLVREAEKRKFL